MATVGFISTIVVAMLTCVLLLPIPALLRRWGVVDHSTPRSSHIGEIPRGAGLVLLVAFTWVGVLGGQAAGIALTNSMLIGWAGIAVMAGVGFLEDAAGAPVLFRLGLQLLVGAVLYLAAPERVGLSVVIGIVAAAVCFAAVVNTVNFMDGLNGLTALSAIPLSVCYAGIAAIEQRPDVVGLALLLLGVAVGFLPHNFPVARLFLGDSGSYFIGSVTAVMALELWSTGVSPLIVFSPLVVAFADVGRTLLRRIARGDKFWRAHREHHYQQLAHGSQGQVRTTALVAGLGVLAAVSAFMTAAGTQPMLSHLAVLVMIVLSYFLVPVSKPRTNAVHRAAPVAATRD